MADMGWKGSFDTVTILDQFMGPCKYNIEIEFDVETDDPEQQNISFLRIKYLIENLYQDSMFISLDHEQLPVFKNNFRSPVTTFIMEPLDLVIALTTWHKIHSISQGSILLESLKLSSSQSDNLIINVTEDFIQDSNMLQEDPFKQFGRPAWWFRPDAGTEDWIESLDGKIKVSYHAQDWPDFLQLGNDDKLITEERKIDNIISLDRKWKPEVITGDKT